MQIDTGYLDAKEGTRNTNLWTQINDDSNWNPLTVMLESNWYQVQLKSMALQCCLWLADLVLCSKRDWVTLNLLQIISSDCFLRQIALSNHWKLSISFACDLMRWRWWKNMGEHQKGQIMVPNVTVNQTFVMTEMLSVPRHQEMR